MRFYTLVVIIISAALCFNCKSKANKNVIISDSDYENVLTERENHAANNPIEIDGQLISTVYFEVKTDKADFENGIKPWASIENPQIDIPNLIEKDIIVISENKVSVIIDYPLTNFYQFNLKSDKGFTREMLLTEISRHFYKLYAEEEKSATIKTLPMEKRTMYNRNQTNGKYGIWGHDIGDLVLSSIKVFKEKNNKIVLALGVDS
jgi:hypothetical protein